MSSYWLTTLHTHRLVNSHTLSKLEPLDIRLVKTWLPEEDEGIEDLEPYLVGRIPAKYVAPFTNEVQKLASESRIPDAFKGSFHCETILLSLYLMAREGTDHAGVGSDLKSWGTKPLPAACSCYQSMLSCLRFVGECSRNRTGD
jgi:hypothetical protein